MEIINRGKIFIVTITTLFFILSTAFVVTSVYIHTDRIKQEKQKLLVEKTKKEFEESQKILAEKQQEEELQSLITKRVINIDGSNFEIPTEGKAIIADLTSMKIQLVSDGIVEKEIEILAKGKEGSRYETPIGTYKVITKEENHKITVRDIYMPYSMQFFGNFFIHGRPYYSNGTPLQDGDSGGCIRLSTENAKIVYDFAKVGTSIFIMEQDKSEDLASIVKTFHEQSSKINSTPEVSADSYVVADVSTGYVFAEKDSDKKIPILSLTNLMTAVVSDEIYRDDKKITIKPDSDTLLINQDIKTGEIFTSTEILRPLLMVNSDIASESIARTAGKDVFIGLMNIKAKALKMNNTKYYDPIGSNLQNTSTAGDLFKLVSYFYRKHPYLTKVTTVKNYSLDQNSRHGNYVWENNSSLLGGSTLLAKDGSSNETKGFATSVHNVKINGKDRKIAVVVIGSESQEKDTKSLIDWTENSWNNNVVAIEN